MNRKELVNLVAEKAGLSKVAAKAAVDATFETLGESLQKGEAVSLLGFGSFSVKERPARQGRNPRTGATLKIAAKKCVRFKAGSALEAKL